jgi:hypothetical protein
MWCALTKNKFVGPFFFEGPAMTGYTLLADGKHCFASCPCANSFPVRWCTTSLLPSCSCLSGQGVSRSFDKKRGISSLGYSFSRFYSSESFLLGFVKEALAADLDR